MLNLQIIERRTCTGMQQILVLNGAVWHVEDLASELVEYGKTLLTEKLVEEERQASASTDLDARTEFASSSATR